MASFSIHLAVGKRYIEKNIGIIKNEDEFYQGIITPDLVDDKMLSHYTVRVSTDSLENCLREKVHLEKFLDDTNIDTDYEKGLFLHLVTDYLFYNKFFDKDYIASVTYLEYSNSLYYSYNAVNEYIDTTYNLDYSKYVDVINENIEKNNKKRHLTYDSGTNILPLDKLYKFIEDVSNVNLEEYRNTILEKHKNVLPDCISD